MTVRHRKTLRQLFLSSARQFFPPVHLSYTKAYRITRTWPHREKQDIETAKIKTVTYKNDRPMDNLSFKTVRFIRRSFKT